jgi:hypothetical protein
MDEWNIQTMLMKISQMDGSLFIQQNVPDDQSPLASGVLPAREADQQEA